MSRVLVTGAEGFTGRYLTADLLANGHEVYGIVHHNKFNIEIGSLENLAGLYTCDLLDSIALERIIKLTRPDHVVHLAAITFVGHDDADAIYRTNIVGTRNLLQALATIDSVASGVLLASSANIYGSSVEGVIDESIAPAPANDYAVSKLAMEHMAAQWRDRLQINIVRPFNYTGIGQSTRFLIPKIVDHFKRKASVIELGNLDVERDFSDVRTVVQCYRKLLNAPTAGQTVNVCSSRGYTLRSILDLASVATGHFPEIRVNPEFVRSNEVHRLVGSKTRLEQIIGPVIGPEFKETLEWMLS